jgi:uncharacterized protein (DUF433 family)
MNWKQFIHSDADILTGKPVVRGTRLSVDFILRLFASGWSEQEVLENYPTLTHESLQAVFAFAAEIASDAGVDVISRQLFQSKPALAAAVHSKSSTSQSQ